MCYFLTSSVKTVIQADKKDASDETKKRLGIIETLIKIIRTKGPVSLYRGFMANMANTFIQQFAYFYWYTLVRSVYIKRILRSTVAAPSLNVMTELVLGALAAAFAQLFTTPVGVVATRQQIGADHHEADNTFTGHIKDIFRTDGITGFWRGLKPGLVLTVNPAITYGVFERVKNIILAASDGQMTPGKSFVIGALSKTLATIVTFPYIISKVRLQAKDTPYKDSFHVLGHTYKEKGFFGLYQGMNAQITKAVLSQALLFYFRDYFEIWTRQILALYAKKA
ncbi:unnamed protein product [Malassezia sympodialis ATCC 42132]|uniref:uncharacterized protein n=1 Tax=Malassezia sympodialis (strain ATCC 42132) TaxID=1230383 RepID=UPI0002C24DCD|nr:uncharacterized protein MSY001_2377 [Malassezia sympodialis ATCC 42132]CCU99671.1 unnamed protein product [Malassezia sympodialis ATCC 42132]|eukprot:XP_018740906.1 uncharacterized protein MSY001_2377 [Malassezia sympodialis ATCC 42132]